MPPQIPSLLVASEEGAGPQRELTYPLETGLCAGLLVLRQFNNSASTELFLTPLVRPEWSFPDTQLWLTLPQYM